MTRDFVRELQPPILILPDDIPAHPYDVAIEAAMLAPQSELSMFPWKQPVERIPVAVRQIRSFPPGAPTGCSRLIEEVPGRSLSRRRSMTARFHPWGWR